MTILLVSHNMAAIQSACGRVLYLDGGRIAGIGEAAAMIEHYRDAVLATEDRGVPPVDAPADAPAVNIVGFEISGEDGLSRREISFDEPVRIRIDLHAQRRIETPQINFGLKRGDGVIICNFNNWYDDFKIDYIDGPCILEGWLPPMRLVPDYYEIHVLVWHWGGAHLPGDPTRSMPLAARTFGDLRVRGPALNSHDGVFQIPARKWRFTRGAHTVEYAAMNPRSISDVFTDGGAVR
jgi:hypothetical protein